MRDTKPRATERGTEESGKEWRGDARSPRQRLERRRINRDAPSSETDTGRGARTRKVSSRTWGWVGGAGFGLGAGLQGGGPMRTHVPHAGVTTLQLILKRRDRTSCGAETRRD